MIDVFEGGDHGFDLVMIEPGHVEERERFLRVLAAEHETELPALPVQAVEFVLGQGEAILGEDEMQGVGCMSAPPRGLEIGEAALRKKVRVRHGHVEEREHYPIHVLA